MVTFPILSHSLTVLLSIVPLSPIAPMEVRRGRDDGPMVFLDLTSRIHSLAKGATFLYDPYYCIYLFMTLAAPLTFYATT